MSLVVWMTGASKEAPPHIAAGILVGGLTTVMMGMPASVVLATLGGSWGERLLGSAGVPVGVIGTLVLVPVSLFALGGVLGAAVAWCVGRIMRMALSHAGYHAGNG
jgi:hypothetical protein